MRKRNHRVIALIVTGWALVLPSATRGQMTPVPPRPLGPATPPASVLMNPLVNPYLNPYLNPGVSPQPMSGGDAALYLFSAQAARGGIGSGRLGGPREASPAPRPALMPDSAAVPGAGASRFFNPGPVNSNGAGRYYNRRQRYFQSTGR